MLSPTWGVYSGYELCENVACGPGQRGVPGLGEVPVPAARLGPRRKRAPPYAGIAPFITHLNLMRAIHPALHRLRNLRFHYRDQPEILCFSKSTGSGGWQGERDTVLVVVNLDPHQPREATVWLDEPALGVDAGGGSSRSPTS